MTPVSWRVAAASAIGSAHERSGGGCQDRYRWAVVDDAERAAVLVVVVSDGAGSAALGEHGAEIVCDGFLRRVVGELSTTSVLSLERGRVPSWVADLRAELVEHAASAGRQLEDYASTLVAAIVGPTRTLLVHLGDGGIVVDDAEGWTCASWPQHREYAGSCWFVVDADAAERVVVGDLDRAVTEIALFSDGLERMVLQFDGFRPHGPFFDKVFAPVRALGVSSSSELDAALLRTLSSPIVRERTNDDATLLLASRLGPRS